MKPLGRDAAELTALADHLFAHGLVLEMLADPLAGMYDPSGHGTLLFLVQGTNEGLDPARAGGRPTRPSAGDDRGAGTSRPRPARPPGNTVTSITSEVTR
jgi:hypothetical protein